MSTLQYNCQNLMTQLNLLTRENVTLTKRMKKLKPIFIRIMQNQLANIVTQNLHDSVPYFSACLPEIWGQDRANFV